jgi:tetratricopeptide (TPR) repeat protein
MKKQTTLCLAAGFAMSMVFSVAQVMAQGGQGGQTPQTPPAGGSTRAPSPSTPSPSPLPGSRDRQQTPQIGQEDRTPFPEIRRPVFLSGKVVMDDGTPPPDSVVIERVCNGVPRPEGYTDSKGRFSIQLGQNAHMVADASVGGSDPGFGMPTTGTSRSQDSRMNDSFGGISHRDLIGCELRASLPGYRSDVVMLSGRRMFDNPDVGTIILHRLGNVEGTTISFTSLQAPKESRKAYDKGRQRMSKKKWADGQKEFEKAVNIYPEYAAAWFELGRSLEQQDKINEAREAYQKALASDGKFVNPYLQLAALSARENKWQEVVDTTNRVVKLNPFDFPGAYFFNSIANYNLKNLDAAESSAREALKVDKNHRYPKIEHLLGVILAQKGDFSGAAEHMKGYLKLVPDATDADVVKKQVAELEGLMGVSAPSNQQPQ